MARSSRAPGAPARSTAGTPRLERRELLKLLALLAGGALSPACASFAREGRRAPHTAAPAVLDPSERELVASACQVILPATDTPGAREAGVPDFIEWLLAEWFEESEVREFRAGLARLDGMARARAGAPFAKADEAVQITVLAELEQEALAAHPPGGPSLLGERMGSYSEPPEAFFTTLKELVLVGYYTSEIGATRELALFVAGDYQPCVPYARLGRAWSEYW